MNQSKFSILAVDDEQSMLSVYKLLLREYDINVASNIKDARAFMEKHAVCLVLLDLGLPGQSGLDFLEGFRDRHPTSDVIVVTSDASAQSGVRAMRLGARDYILKPFDDDDLGRKIQQIFQEHVHKECIQHWEDTVDQTREPLMGNSPQMKRVQHMIQVAAESDAPVLINGESGTGKELVAHAIHAHSYRASGRFVETNCGAFSESLINSELFGHEKGSFTGASQMRKGCFEQAEKGTLFLDELCSISKDAQVRLLRALEEGTIIRVGGEEKIPIDVRILAATSSDLKTLIKSGHFREDLYYRLNVLQIEIPPLRERGDDIMLLAHYFLKKFNAMYGKSVQGFSAEFEMSLRLKEWRGNVRELCNFIHRMMVTGNEEVLTDPVAFQFAIIPPGEDVPSTTLTLTEAQELFRKNYVHAVIERCDGDRKKAARVLGTSVSTIYRLVGREENDLASVSSRPPEP